MAGELRIGPTANLARTDMAVSPARRRGDGEGGRDFGAELEEQARHPEERGSAGGEREERDAKEHELHPRPREQRDEASSTDSDPEVGGSLDVVA